MHFDAHSARPIPKGAFTVSEFCSTFSVGRTALYEAWRQGRGPRFFQIGKRRLISSESAFDWVRNLEAESRSQLPQG
jgi:hypothetical protein